MGQQRPSRVREAQLGFAAHEDEVEGGDEENDTGTVLVLLVLPLLLLLLPLQSLERSVRKVGSRSAAAAVAYRRYP